MSDKMFTLSEANALLPQLKEDLARLQQMAREFEEQYAGLQKAKAGEGRSAGPASPDPFFEAESRLEFMKLELELQIRNFSRKGVLLKMINPGLIDFPSVLDGQEVLICWKEGEEQASHYHGWHDGFAGRKAHPEA